MMVLEQFKLDGKTAVVTGAGRGLGKAMAMALAEAGANIAVVDIDPESAQQSADEIETLDVSTTAVQADVTDENDVKRMVSEVADALGSVEIQVNNAGIGVSAPAEEMTKEQWQTVIDLNLTGGFLCSKYIGQQMIEQDGGSIINISSVAALTVNQSSPQIGYNASKAGVGMITRSLASEWSEHGIRVNAIAPGWMRAEPAGKGQGEDQEAECWAAETPLGRLGRPEELGGVVVFLASEASSYMTGEVVVYDGGYTI